MVFVQEITVKGKKYLQINKTVRVGKRVFKVSKHLGKKSDFTTKKLKEEGKKFALEFEDKLQRLITKQAKKIYAQKYPLTNEEIEKIELMNIKYYEIKRSLHKQDWIDLKKRFIANFVFESNALEGNSLTLKNVSEIVFENKIHQSADLRDVYDAKNSYTVFSKLFSAKKQISEQLIIDIHKKIMKNIDDRIGYKKSPNVIIGRHLKLTPPEQVQKDIKTLLKWYKNQKNMHPLKLAFTFHHKFEKIHPFSDGNGRVGRMLLNYILIKKGYYPIIIRKTQRTPYLKALQAADNGNDIPLIRFALAKAKDTYRKFFETYYNYI